MSTPPEHFPNALGQLLCTACNGKHESIDFGSFKLDGPACSACGGSGRIMSGWPDAFTRMLTFTAPVTEDLKWFDRRDPTTGAGFMLTTVRWDLVERLSLGPVMQAVWCRSTNVILDDGTVATHQSRDIVYPKAPVHITLAHTRSGLLVVGFPLEVMTAEWNRYLMRAEGRARA